MKKNVGKTDKMIRIIVGIVLLLIAFVYGSWLAGIIGVLALLTGIINFCGLYALLGISTVKEEKKDEPRGPMVNGQ